METSVDKMNFSSFQIVAQKQRQPKTVFNSPILDSQSTINGVRNYLLNKLMVNEYIIHIFDNFRSTVVNF